MNRAECFGLLYAWCIMAVCCWFITKSVIATIISAIALAIMFTGFALIHNSMMKRNKPMGSNIKLKKGGDY